MKRDVILILDGGAMEGVFGAGIVVSFQEKNIYQHIHSIYGISAGAHNGAYFLSENAKNGAKVYYEDLTIKNKFIKTLSFKKMVHKIKRFFIKKKTLDILNLEYLKNIEKTKTKLNQDKIEKSKIEFWIKLFNPRKMEVKWVNGKKDMLKKLKEASSAVPYASSKKIKFFDGQIIDGLNINEIIEKYPNKRIIIALNKKISLLQDFKDIPYNFIRIILETRYFGIKYLLKKIKKPTNINKIKKQKNVYFIEPPYNISQLTTDKDKLYNFYKEGIKKGNECIKKLNLI
ncbi:MAG: patatin-like phospholipase family protein [Candidatus Pacearchaeota archaeon]|jgi:predicted patatin/cPLA2 family phospholipase